MNRRRWVLLGTSGAAALIALTSLPGPVFGAATPPGGATLTRLYDPSSATTTFTVDADRASHAALSLETCPGARVVAVDGPGAAVTAESSGGTTITFPSEGAGTWRVVVAGDSPGLGVGGRQPSGCGDAALLIDPAVVERAGAEVGPSTRISMLP
jgi:hypothetical protein